MPAAVAPPDNPQKRRELGGAGGAGKAGGSGKAGGGIRAPVPTSRVQMERNVCNKLSHFCRRPSKYQTWLMAASRPRSRRPTATTRKAKISCAAREQKKKAQINHDS